MGLPPREPVFITSQGDQHLLVYIDLTNDLPRSLVQSLPKTRDMENGTRSYICLCIYQWLGFVVQHMSNLHFLHYF
jgi:hypothetical protein